MRKHFTIPDATPVIVDAGQPQRTTWGQFLDDNRDGIEAGYVAPEAILSTWERVSTATYHGGGGAMAAWSIRLANAGGA